MKKEEIIKNLISGFGQISANVVNSDLSGQIKQVGFLYNSSFVMVDIDKLSKFLAKYVVKEDLIEE